MCNFDFDYMHEIIHQYLWLEFTPYYNSWYADSRYSVLLCELAMHSLQRLLQVTT